MVSGLLPRSDAGPKPGYAAASGNRRQAWLSAKLTWASSPGMPPGRNLFMHWHRIAAILGSVACLSGAAAADWAYAQPGQPRSDINSVFLDPETKTMIDYGDPKVLVEQSENEKVRRFLARGGTHAVSGAAGDTP